MTRSNKYWVLIITVLIVIIAVGSIVTWARYHQSQPVEISISPAQELQGEIYIGGAVNNPGLYSLRAGDNLEERGGEEDVRYGRLRRPLRRRLTRWVKRPEVNYSGASGLWPQLSAPQHHRPQ